jgi:hypothetical protein
MLALGEIKGALRHFSHFLAGLMAHDPPALAALSQPPLLAPPSPDKAVLALLSQDNESGMTGASGGGAAGDGGGGGGHGGGAAGSRMMQCNLRAGVFIGCLYVGATLHCVGDADLAVAFLEKSAAACQRTAPKPPTPPQSVIPPHLHLLLQPPQPQQAVGLPSGGETGEGAAQAHQRAPAAAAAAVLGARERDRDVARVHEEEEERALAAAIATPAHNHTTPAAGDVNPEGVDDVGDEAPPPPPPAPPLLLTGGEAGGRLHEMHQGTTCKASEEASSSSGGMDQHARMAGIGVVPVATVVGGVVGVGGGGGVAPAAGIGASAAPPACGSWSGGQSLVREPLLRDLLLVLPWLKSARAQCHAESARAHCPATLATIGPKSTHEDKCCDVAAGVGACAGGMPEGDARGAAALQLLQVLVQKYKY